MKEKEPPVEALQFLARADAFACFCRLWWDGAGVDAVAWWQDAAGYSRRVLSSGAQTDSKALIPELTESVLEESVYSIIAKFIELGICSLPSQENRLIYTNFDVWFGVKKSSTSEPHWVKVRGGKHADSRGEALLDAVFAQCPEVAPQIE